MAPKAKYAVLDTLRNRMSSVFNQAQMSTANHRKNCMFMHKIHLEASDIARHSRKGELPTGEDTFCDTFLDMVSMLLTMKKGSPTASRVVLFVAAYAGFALDKEHACKPGSSTPPTMRPLAKDSDSIAFRFMSRLLSHVLEGFQSKHNVVRHRCVNIVAELTMNVNKLDEDACAVLGKELMLRTRDKEQSIRSLAVVALCNLISRHMHDTAVDRENIASITKFVLDSLCYDRSAEVRRTALLHTPVTNATIPFLLTRSRDVDINVRSLLFSTILLPRSTCRKSRATTSCYFSDIRELCSSHREKVVRDGLGDREPKVRAAAAHMLGVWFDVLADEVRTELTEEVKKVTENAYVMEPIFVFLRLFDFISLDGKSIAPDALSSFFCTRPDAVEAVVFSDGYWSSLTPTSALFARVLIQHVAAQGVSQLDAIGVPVIIVFSFHIQEACNAMLDAIEHLEEAKLTDGTLHEFGQAPDAPYIKQLERSVVEAAFVVSELLKIAAGLDFSDEIGRRQMFAVIRDMLTHKYLPECLIESCMNVLQEVAPSERELVRIVVEIINELQDSVTKQEGTDGVHSMSTTSSSQTTMNDTAHSISVGFAKDKLDLQVGSQVDEMDLRCLSICITMLERINGTFDENSTLHGVLSHLIIPAVKREDIAFRERGLISLGLCSLLTEDLARSSFQLFINQVQCTPEALKLKVLHIMFDLLMTHAGALLNHSKDKSELIIAFLLQTLEYEKSPAVQAALCIGLSKLLLNGFVHDERILSVLVLSYASPATADNQHLRQCLAYFFPAYSYSSAANQGRMQSIFLTVFNVLLGIYEADEEAVVSPLQFAAEFLDWLDSDKLASQAIPDAREDAYLQLACDIATALYDESRTDQTRKILSQILGKLTFPQTGDLGLLSRLKVLLDGIPKNRPFDDSAGQRTLQKFTSRFMKHYASQIENAGDTQLRDDPLFLAACELAGISLEETDGTEDECDDDEGQERAESSSTRRNLSPMKPSVKRKISSAFASENEPMNTLDDSLPRSASHLPYTSARNKQPEDFAAPWSPLSKRYR